MTASSSRMDRLVALLGGWPDHFGEQEQKHGESLLSVLSRERVLDEAVFGLVIRYATHRAEYDRLSVAIKKSATDADDVVTKGTATSYLSGEEQSRAFHENKLLILERELLATPYSRAKQGGSAQSSFMDLLDDLPPEGGNEGSAAKGGKVTPFKPMAKKTRA